MVKRKYYLNYQGREGKEREGEGREGGGGFEVRSYYRAIQPINLLSFP